MKSDQGAGKRKTVNIVTNFSRKRSRYGWTYILASMDGKQVKIGKTSGPLDKRIDTVYREGYSKYNFPFRFAFDDQRLEQPLHDYFIENRACYRRKENLQLTRLEPLYFTLTEARSIIAEESLGDVFVKTPKELFRFPHLKYTSQIDTIICDAARSMGLELKATPQKTGNTTTGPSQTPGTAR
ncbi:MAG: GIY-YIG nuclease family protein [Pontibacterium sp.]